MDPVVAETILLVLRNLEDNLLYGVGVGDGGHAGLLAKKKPQKPYTISKPREKWTADEHNRSPCSACVRPRLEDNRAVGGTKTAMQIRNQLVETILLMLTNLEDNLALQRQT
ncbi:hypothetical protein EJB05_33396, partial [Eragrostis curvula]